MPNREDVVKTLPEALQEAYTDPSQCFGKEFDPTDATCTKECADGESCQRVAEAPLANPRSSLETEEERIMAEKVEKQADAAIEAQKNKPPEKEGKKKTGKPRAKGFGDPSAERDAYGFAVGSKGAFVAALIQAAPITREDLIAKTNAKFETDSAGRVNMVLYKLRQDNFLLIRIPGGGYYLDKITPDALVQKAVKEAEEAAAKKAPPPKKEKVEKKAPVPETAPEPETAPVPGDTPVAGTPMQGDTPKVDHPAPTEVAS